MKTGDLASQSHKTLLRPFKTSDYSQSQQSNTRVFYSTLFAAIFCGLSIQFIIYQLLVKYGDTPTSILTATRSRDIFSRPPRQPHLVRFPADVSYWPPGSNLDKVKHDTDSDRADEKVVTSHAAMDAATIKKVQQRHQVSESTRAEAHASYKAALDMLSHDKKEKARKLLQHAIYLDPLDADILNAYGEVLISSDVVMADHMFKQAIIVSPTHSKALSNIQQTGPVVQEMDSALYNNIDRKRDLLIHIPENHPALRRLKKELYYKHIYHTVAIEGNTLNLHQTRAIIETRVAVGGKSIAEQNEVIGMDAALSYINSTLLNRIGKISLKDILEIHKRVLGYTDPIEAGQLRNTQVFVGDYVPPRPGEVQALMDELIDWLNSEQTADLHPIKLAAIAHYKLVTIHPFYDGNGRTSRLLMNLILMHAGYPPVMIKVEQKHEYYKYLETANQGDIRPFIRFIAKCTERTVDEYIAALTETMDNSHDLAQYNYVDDGRTIILGDSDNTN